MLNLDISLYDLNEADVIQPDEKTFLVTRWNWDYLKALDFQNACAELVRLDKQVKVFIFTSHPHCFTMGRGLQKSQGKVIDGLVEMSEEKFKNLSFPLYKIGRGGGLTFHYPGQWIFYPIINLNSPNHDLSSLVNKMLQTSKNILHESLELDIETKKGELMGLWTGPYKFASLGLEIKKFVTLHGMAINFLDDQDIFQALKMTNPCGLAAVTYQSLELLKKGCLQENSVFDFHGLFLESFFK